MKIAINSEIASYNALSTLPSCTIVNYN